MNPETSLMATTLIPDESKNLAVNDQHFQSLILKLFFLIYAIVLTLQVLRWRILMLKSLHNRWFLVHEEFRQALEVFQYMHACPLFHVRKHTVLKWKYPLKIYDESRMSYVQEQIEGTFRITTKYGI